ncbi:MAG: HAMP domain-containing histidine kinase [Oscillospiraceae bacterium]|jgi:signal transduction histidine kinase|nr:HAMP domain-containing histidine kinase [Oscillospiraceae bacterium]
MLTKLRRSMTALCTAGAAIIGAVLMLVSLAISERQLIERGRGQALFDSNVEAIAFRLGTEAMLDWTWLSRMEADGNILAHIEDNGAVMLFSGRGDADGQREALTAIVQNTARESYGVDTKKRPDSALTNEQASFRVSYGGEAYRAGVVVIRTPTGHKSLTMLGSTAEERAEILRQRLTYLGLLAASAAAFWLFARWFTSRAIRPIAESHKRQSEFIAAASHELRTPLAVIRTNAAAIEGKESERGFISAIERECARTGKLVDDLLMLANADAGAWRMDVSPVEPGELLTECVEAFRASAEVKGQKLTLHLPRTLPVIAGDELRLKQLCSILLDNALYYTPEGGTITVTASSKNKHVKIEVADSGTGIPMDERERVFERFYRLDKVRSQKEHYGLGLPIAKEIVELHHGSISLSDTPDGGLTVTVRLSAGFDKRV